MTLSHSDLLESLYAPTTIPIVPYKNGQIDMKGHAKNIEYLMTHNYLDNGRKRVISVAGTSLIHHIEPMDQTRIFDTMGQVMGDDGVLMSAIVPTPIGTAGRLIEEQSQLKRPPDVYLIMPLGGIYSPEGMYDTFMQFGEAYGSTCDARLIYYFRQPRDRAVAIQLLNDSPHFVGVKIGTGIEDVQPFLDGVGDNAMVIWGIGDRSTDAAEVGSKGHTSGTAVVCAKVADEINNAQRRGDFAAAREMEALITPLEEIRFHDGRKYNYAAVVEAMNQSGFDDIVGGDGGPFNPRVPASVVAEVQAAVEIVKDYH
ncbi:MAG: dihydrodipicolinate synthase family protein [Chloroflexota bacterium]